MLVAHEDWETRSAADLRKTGVHKYCEHPSTFGWCLSWRIINTVTGRVVHRGMWVPHVTAEPTALLEHKAAGGIVVGHNTGFERTFWNTVILRWFPHFPRLEIEQMNCTMARAAALALPQSLEIVGMVLKTKAAKDMQGHALMMKMSSPRKINEDGSYVWWDADDLQTRLRQYCDADVNAECEIDARLPQLSASETKVWHLDQRINDRGVQLDIPMIERAVAVREAAKRLANERMTVLTGGVVTKCSQTARLAAWITSRGIPCKSVSKDHREELLLASSAEGFDDVHEALELRIEAGQEGPTAKYVAMLNCACADGRARGLLHYHGAGPGRWAGRLIQPQNLYRVDPDRDGDSIAMTLDIIANFSAEDAAVLLQLLFGSALKMLAKATRQMFIAKPGHRLIGADLSNIEGRLAAWFADEEWKLEAFREYDAGRGADLYCVAYGKAFSEEPKAVAKQKAKRQIGKVMELALGYQGSVGSFISMGRVYGLKAAQLVPVVMSIAPDAYGMWHDRYAKARDKRGLPQDQWAAIKVIVTGWREAHPKLVQSWWDLQDAAIEAVGNPGKIVPCLNNRVAYVATPGWLWCQLPQGRVIAYANPRVVQHVEEWIEWLGERHDCTRDAAGALDAWSQTLLSLGGTLKENRKRRVDYEGYENDKKRWATFSLYGGMQFNHVVQGTARDVMVGGMMRVEAKGYPIVLTVHDECLAEAPIGFGSIDDFVSAMVAGETWLQGCPLAAKGQEGPRYDK